MEIKIEDMIKNKRVLILPRMEDTNLYENQNILTSPIYKLSELCSALKAKSVVLNDHKFDYDIVVGMYSGDDLTTEGNDENKILKSGKTFIEFSWCKINSAWFLERITVDGIINDNINKNTYGVDGIEVYTKHKGVNF
jgi:hypothetical protein